MARQRKKTVERTCQNPECGVSFMAEPHLVRSGGARYCTHPCAMRAVAKDARESGRFRGKRNPSWKGGVSADKVRYKNRFRERWPIKAAAHDVVTQAMKRGEIVRKPCEECGHEKASAHHDDYAKPLDVRWLCKPCHIEWHHHNEPLNGGEPQLEYVHNADRNGRRKKGAALREKRRLQDQERSFREIVAERIELRRRGIDPDAP